MWSLVNFVTFALFVQIFKEQKVFGQECKFVLENGEEISNNGSGFDLQAIQNNDKPRKVLLVAETSNVVNITGVTSTTGPLYMKPILCQSYLLLKLTDEFANHENHKSLETVSITVTFECLTGTRTIKFIQPIERNPGSDMAGTQRVNRKRRSSCSCNGSAACSCADSCRCEGSAICNGSAKCSGSAQCGGSAVCNNS